MFDENDVFITSATFIVPLNAVQCMKRLLRFWIRSSHLSKEKYSTTDFYERSNFR